MRLGASGRAMKKDFFNILLGPKGPELKLQRRPLLSGHDFLDNPVLVENDEDVVAFDVGP
jgi:hypothetical protein